MSDLRKNKGSGNMSGKPEFHIRMQSNQNSSFQGELHWLNTGEKINFRSFLELVTLIQEAMDVSPVLQAETICRSWNIEDRLIKDINGQITAT